MGQPQQAEIHSSLLNGDCWNCIANFFFFFKKESEEFCNDDGDRLLWLKVQKRYQKIEVTRMSFRALIPFRKIINNNNLRQMQYGREEKKEKTYKNFTYVVRY